MKAIAYQASGPAGTFTEMDLPLPVPGEYEVLIEMHATSFDPNGLVNPPVPPGGERYDLPVIPGTDIAGVVAGTGPGVTRFKPGDEVFGYTKGGTYAEYTLAQENELALKPAGVAFGTAGIIPAAGLAAWQALASAQVSGRDRVLVHDGAGGTGSFAVQLAVLRGATVITTVSSEEELDLAWGIGADQAINSSEQDFAAILGTSIDVVIDTCGGSLPEKSIAVLAPGGRLVSAAGTPDPAHASQQGITAASITPAADVFQLAELARLTAGRRLKPLNTASFPLSAEGLRSAYLLNEERQVPGVIAIRIK